MKKKIIAFIGTVLLVASMSMTAFAAPSVTGGIITGIESATDRDNRLTTGLVIVDAEETAAVTEIKQVSKLKNVLGSAYQTGMGVADVKEVRADESVAFPVKVVFQAKGVKAGDTVAVLCLVGDEWQVVEAVAGDGTITATLAQAGIVTFVTKTAATSPSTGTPVMMAVVVVALGAAGVVSSKKKA